jgi:hypothetical protein
VPTIHNDFQPWLRLGQHGGGGGAVAGHIVGFGGRFFEQLRPHIFKGVGQFNLLGHGNAVVGYGGRALFFIQGHIAAFGPVVVK